MLCAVVLYAGCGGQSLHHCVLSPQTLHGGPAHHPSSVLPGAFCPSFCPPFTRVALSRLCCGLCCGCTGSQGALGPSSTVVTRLEQHWRRVGSVSQAGFLYIPRLKTLPPEKGFFFPLSVRAGGASPGTRGWGERQERGQPLPSDAGHERGSETLNRGNKEQSSCSMAQTKRHTYSRVSGGETYCPTPGRAVGRYRGVSGCSLWPCRIELGWC